ncbi:MAG: sigma 54-interacting transcriptional regulator [Chitinivibrionales bacterium]|nr:sigma 54-interacting transcriptional regulator [Chitinivibrionales bacterium]
MNIPESDFQNLKNEIAEYKSKLELLERLTSNRNKFQMALSVIPPIIVELNTEMEVVYVNQIALDAFGYTLDELKQNPCCVNYFASFDRDRIYHDAINVLKGDFGNPKEYKCLKKDGSYFDVLIQSTPLIKDGEIKGLRSNIIDLAEYKKSAAADFEHFLQETDKTYYVTRKLKNVIIKNSSFQNIISVHEEMKEIFRVLPDIANSSASVLITGESGTGKELVARALHNLSPRRSKPFIPINCGAIPENLLESELYGYKAGAFTDARKDKVGRIQAANEGSLFLDEIGDISPNMQIRLLRTLQDKSLEPLGSITPIPVDVRVISATNKNLNDLITIGVFRNDFYYRIKVFNIHLPPLRERRCDIALLCDFYIDVFNNRYQKTITGISPEAFAFLSEYDYPGNIRELSNLIEHAVIICSGRNIGLHHFPHDFHAGKKAKSSQSIPPSTISIKELEKDHIFHIIQMSSGNKSLAAKRLGVHRTTLIRKLKKLEMSESRTPSLSGP